MLNIDVLTPKKYMKEHGYTSNVRWGFGSTNTQMAVITPQLYSEKFGPEKFNIRLSLSTGDDGMYNDLPEVTQ